MVKDVVGKAQTEGGNMLTAIQLNRCVKQLKELLYKKQVNEKEIKQAKALIEKGVKLSEKPTLLKKNKKDVFKNYIIKFLSPSNDQLMAGHWATVTKGTSKKALSWYQSAELKNELYREIWQKYNWLPSAVYEADTAKVMDLERYTNSIFKTVKEPNPYQLGINRIKEKMQLAYRYA